MKQELLTAVVLLAAGAGLWLWQNNEESNSHESNWLRSAPAFANPNIENASEQNFASHAGAAMQQNTFVQQAAWQSDTTDMNPRQSQAGQQGALINRDAKSVSSKSKASSANSVPDLVAIDTPSNLRIAQSDPAAQQLLYQLAQQINSSGPIQSTFSLRSSLYGADLQAEGRYWQIGQGSGNARKTGKARMELVFSTQPVRRSLLQICDGRFVFYVKQTGSGQKIDFLDLDRLRNQDAHLSVATTPASWIAQGSLANLYQHLATGFKFHPPKAQAIGNETVYQLTGDWRPRELFQLLDGVVKRKHLTPIIELKKIPAQIPHAVRLAIKADSNNQLTPVSIQYFRYDGSDNAPATAYDHPLVEIKFDRFERVATLDNRLFTLQSSDGESVDMTDDYNRRVDELLKDLPKVAGQNSEIR